jgi:hypothetical protein
MSTDAGELVPATSKIRLKGPRHVEVLGSTWNKAATPALEDGQTPDTAEDIAAPVRRPIRSPASVAPNPQPRAGDQQETKCRDTLVMDPPRLRLSTFAIPPASSPSEAQPPEAPPSPTLRTESNHTRQSLDRVPHAHRIKVIPTTGPLVRKYAGTSYIYNPTDVANRYSRFKREGILKVSQHSIRYRAKLDDPPNKPRLSAWQRL